MSPGSSPPPPASSVLVPDGLVEDPTVRHPLLDRLPLVRDVETPRLVGALRRAAVALAALGLGACVVQGAQRPPDPVLVDEFGTVVVRVRAPSGELLPSEHCAQLAETDEQRIRGLRGRTSVEPYAGMVFRFPGDTAAQFTMQGVPMGLSIGFFAADGTFVSSADMAPCDAAAGCPTYGATGPFRIALEVPPGGLGAIGIGPGSKLELGGPCTPGEAPQP